MKKLIIVLFFLTVFNIFINEKNSIVRFRVIPNSNSVQDIFMKEKVLDEAQKYISNIEDLDRSQINDLTKTLSLEIDSLFKEYSYDKSFSVKYKDNYFPQKEYNGITYDEGYYESLVIEIGDAKGDNYWCFLYPNMCFIEMEETNKDINNIKFESYFKKLINKIF